MNSKIMNTLMNTGGMSYKHMLFALLFATAMSLYIFFIYRNVTKTSFYSRQFNMTLPIVCILTASIVIAMQANLVVSLGMVGALSIVRFRTALKDPMDLGFVFWAISVGIISGTELYALAIITSLLVTMALFGLDLIPTKEAPQLLIVNGEPVNYEEELTETISQFTNKFKIKSKNQNIDSSDYIVELRIADGSELLDALQGIEGITNLSMLNHDGSLR